MFDRGLTDYSSPQLASFNMQGARTGLLLKFLDEGMKMY